MNTGTRLATPAIEREDRPDGSIFLHNRAPLPDPLPDPLARWNHWLSDGPDATFMTERSAAGIQIASRQDIDRLSDAYAVFLTGEGAGPGDRVAVLGAAGIAHAALKIAMLKANLVHVPLAPTLPDSAYGRARLTTFLSIAKPKLTLDLKDVALPDGLKTQRFVRRPSTLDDPAAIYFTSGSTGEPKGVSITRRMIASCQSAYAAHWPFLAHHRPALIDWLPWHHVFGGLDNFYKMIWNGGEYHAELPPGADNMDASATRIRNVRPTLHINVPYGIDLLLDHLEDDPDTRNALFGRLDAIFFAGAGMGAETWRRLQDAVGSTSGKKPLLVSGYGATEAGSTMCLSHEPATTTSEIGLPLPGHSLCLAPLDDMHEVRFKGPNLSPGYVTGDGPQRLPLDDEGYFHTGDLARARHDGRPERGLCFDGRLAEDFKLTTGTRVKTGALRHALLAACAPLVRDVAIAGAGRDRLAVILFPAGSDIDPGTLRLKLAAHNTAMPGSSSAIARAVVSDTPPDPNAGEINDKGHLVQAKCLANRADLVERLYADPPDADIIRLDTDKDTNP